jgi:glycosyltransferase involved in cell wall biosynthesis/tetratricopeptide (TPR) repeat protein
MPIKFHGQHRDNILNQLVNKWLPGGPPVAILQGFPGCGKSQLAVAVATRAPRSLDPVEPATSADPVVDLFLELAIALEAHGLLGLMQEIDKGGKAKLDKALLNVLRHEQILIVVDEFQRLLPKDQSKPPQIWAKMVEDLSNSPHAQGRLLLISNRVIKIERWSENCQIEEVQGLPDAEAEALFTELLESKGVAKKVPPEKRRKIAHLLAGNPRALKTLVNGLRTDSLDNLLSASHDLLQPGDVVLNPRLLEDFERELIERALPKMDAELLKFMRWLSVHRRPFKKEALAQFTGGKETPEALRQQLFDRFLLENIAGGDAPHPLAREISLNRLRAEGKEWTQAHNLAAHYYFRHFKARQLTGASNLAASYAELRHHLYESGRIGEIHEANKRLTRYTLSQINLNTPVPTNKEVLEERIALLSAMPAEGRPKFLEYQLARCLLKRGAVGDKELALTHARRGTGRHPYAAAWILRLNLEYELKGINTALTVIDEALRNVNANEDAAVIYQRGAEILAKADRLDEAIRLLERGMQKIPVEKNLYYLYQTAIEVAEKAGDYFQSEEFVAKGLAAIPKGKYGRHRIAERALRVLSVRNDAEAIRRLLGFTGPLEMDPQQHLLSEYLLVRISGDWVKAIDIAQKYRSLFPSYVPLRANEVDARLALGQVKEADDLMKDYRINETQLEDNPMVWLKAYVSLIAGRLNEAKGLAAMYAPNDFDSGRLLDEAELLRLWSIDRIGFNVPVEDSFPGLVEYRRRIAAQSQPVGKTPMALTSERMCLLVVATEWDSRHGGLSTFNRDLCAALAGAGAHVVCYVPTASAEEKMSASQVEVEIVEAEKMPGTKGMALLFHPPVLPAEFVPDVVIGHDRITGAASVALVKYHYPGSKRVLFIHTSPEEIEWHKEPREDSTSAERAEERKREQLELAKGCDLVVAVGPHLTSEFGTDLQGDGNPVSILSLTPGLPERPDNLASLPPSIRCLVLGRVEDYQLKGLDLAAKAFGRVVANWKQGSPPKLVVRGAPVGTDAALRHRLSEDSGTELDIVIRHYTADEKEIGKDLREASLVLMPSKKEGFGLVGLEAIASGVPTLISAQSGLAETVKIHAPDLVNEWVLPVTADAVTKWAERIEFLLTGREGAFARVNRLREQLATKLDWKPVAAELLKRLALDR